MLLASALTRYKVRARLGVSRAKVYELMASGELGSVRVGGSLRIARGRPWVHLRAKFSTDRGTGYSAARVVVNRECDVHS